MPTIRLVTGKMDITDAPERQGVLGIWAACDTFRRDRSEQTVEFGVRSNDFDQIVFRQRGIVQPGI